MTASFEKLQKLFADWEFRLLEEVSSTNDVVDEMLGDSQKVCVVAKKQISGRGTKGNFWFSDEGGAWLSCGIICERTATDLVSPYVKKIAEILSNKFEKEFYVKPPNDILISGKKIAGILMETQIQSDKIRRIILGIGLNVVNPLNPTIKDIATNLQTEGIEVKVDEIVELLLSATIPFLETMSY